MKTKLIALLAGSLGAVALSPAYAGNIFNFNVIDSDRVERPSFLPADTAFAFSQLQQNDKLNVSWKIADGHYLYKSKLRVTINGDEYVITDMPLSKKHHDQYYGDIEIFDSELMFSVPVAELPLASKVTVHYQGCASAGLCYPPISQTFITQ